MPSARFGEILSVAPPPSARFSLLLLLLLPAASAFTDLSAGPGLRPRLEQPISRRFGQPFCLSAVKARSNRLRSWLPGRLSASASSSAPLPEDDEHNERPLLIPVLLSAFVHMLGVGITLSQLPLYITSLGASPTQLGLAISGFSIAQMIGCPILISLSGTVGRLTVMRVCLVGNALASILTAWSSTWIQIAICRILAGFFAASVPVSQAAVTDIVKPGPRTSSALSQVAAASSLGIVGGPVVAGLVSEVATRIFGAAPHLLPKIVFAVSGLVSAAVSVYLVLAARRVERLTPRAPTSDTATAKPGGVPAEGDEPQASKWFSSRKHQSG